MASNEEEFRSMISTSFKRTFDMFVSNYGTTIPEDIESQKIKLSVKILDEYAAVKDMPPPPVAKPKPAAAVHPQQIPQQNFSDLEPPQVLGTHPYPSGPGVVLTPETAVSGAVTPSSIDKLLHQLPISKERHEADKTSSSLIEYRAAAGLPERYNPPGAAGAAAGSRALSLLTQEEKPVWHAPWKLMRVISGHLGWVRSVSVDISNQWFATGSFDRTIKIWDLASGTLKLTLTGHINSVRGLHISERHPLLFSCGEDKMVKCWDLEYNKVIRQYHGHLSGVYCLAMHPTLDVLVTGGRDCTARVWDIRTKAQIHCLSGHKDSVMDVKAQSTDPQILSSSADCTVRLWDLAAGKPMVVLTNHKKSVRAMALHHSEYSFASGSADNIKSWKFPEGEFLKNYSGHNAIINTLSLNKDNVLFSGADNGSMCFWDWKTGYNFFSTQTIVQPGSLDSEAGVFASAFDHTSSRLITCEADKTIKIWKEDESATPDTHPINFKATRNKKKW